MGGRTGERRRERLLPKLFGERRLRRAQLRELAGKVRQEVRCAVLRGRLSAWVSVVSVGESGESLQWETEPDPLGAPVAPEPPGMRRRALKTRHSHHHPGAAGRGAAGHRHRAATVRAGRGQRGSRFTGACR